MDEISEALRELVQALNGLAVGGVSIAFLALAAIGSVTMAAVQTLKELTPLRRSFQRGRVRGWLHARSGVVGIPRPPSAPASAEGTQKSVPIDAAAVPSPVAVVPGDIAPEQDAVTPVLGAVAAAPKAVEAVRRVHPDLLLCDWAELAVGGNQFAMFSPASELMAVYMKQAVSVMLDEAKRYRDLVAVLSLGVSKEDFEMVLAGPTAETRAEYFDARARLTRRIECTIEGLEVDISTRWKFWMQLSSLVITAAVVEGCVIALPASSPVTYVIAIPMGLLGGYFAPIMRDLVAALQKLRQG